MMFCDIINRKQTEEKSTAADAGDWNKVISFMKKTLLFLLLLLFSCFLSGGTFRIAATADLHGNLRNLSLLAPRIRQAAPHLLVDAGDLTGGDLLAELDGGSSMIEALNLLKCRFRIPGNHDFDVPFADFARQCRSFRGVTLGGDWRWHNVSGVPYQVVKQGKFRLGIIGLTEPGISRRHLPLKSSPRFIHWETALRKALAGLRREKVHFTVLVWHNGLESFPHGVRNVLHKLQGIDLVIAAHSHKEHSGSLVRRTYLVQPGPYALSAALITLHYNDRTFRVEKVRSELLRPRHGEKPAPDLAALNKNAVKPFYSRIRSRVCAPGQLLPRNFSALGAQALKEAGKTQGAVFVCSTARKQKFRNTWFKDLFQLIPYRNTLCTVEVTREELKKILDDLHRNNRKYRRYMGVAGFRWHPGSGRRPGFFQAPPRITITVNSYLMVSSPVLRAIMHRKKHLWRHTELVEREVVEKYLQKKNSP